MTAQQSMIKVKNLVKSYGDMKALDDVTFEVRRGEVLGFLGPNGAGKTTTMKILTCFVAPTSGEAKVAGIDITDDTLEIRRQVGYLPESAPLYVDMRVHEYLSFVAEVRKIQGTKQKQALDKVVETCGLSEVLSKEIRTLSKGYKQRVGLAQAMIHDPQILILDEPTSGLDPNQIVEIRTLIKSIGKERTVILSTHNLSEVQATTNRVIIINSGKLVADGKPEELEADRGGARYNVQLNAKSIQIEDVKKTFESIDKVREVETFEPKGGELSIIVRSKGDSDLRADIFNAVVERKWVLLGLERKQVDLESIFRQLTSKASDAAPAGN
jgi:ABC-2 type transport system ATP-binding protein